MRLVRDQEAVGSNPATPTRDSSRATRIVTPLLFLYFTPDLPQNILSALVTYGLFVNYFFRKELIIRTKLFILEEQL
jgi:hypothetical protein